MSDGLHQQGEKQGRPLLDAEKGVLQALLGSDQRADLGRLRVKPIGDSGPSLSFVNADRKIGRYEKEIGRATYIDDDGVLVSISLSADEFGRLFELDFWKVDFDPLKRYPESSDLLVDKERT